jgi:DNA repair protein RecN (Recombination protein N)
LIQELRIQDFAIIQDLSLDFYEGMTVLTGETGAGKSIIIDAVGLLAGGRGSTEFVRHGAKKCMLEGHFSISDNEELKRALKKYEIDIEDHYLIIQRDIYASGRTVCRVNGAMVTIAALREIGGALIDIHGQNEHQELMYPENHLGLLDYYGDQKLKEAKSAYKELYAKYRKVKKEYDNWQYNEQEMAQKMDILRFQVEEIEEAQLQKNEEELLQEEEQRLSNHQTIVEALNKSYEVLQGEEVSGLDLVGQAMDALDTIAEINDQFKQLAETISTAYFGLQEASSDIYSELDTLEYDEGRLNEIEERLNLIQQLKRKYGNSIEEILEFYQNASDELESIENREGQLDRLGQELEKLEKEIVEKASALSNERRRIAKELEEAIHEQLKELYMEKVVFSANFQLDTTNFTADKAFAQGMDRVEFYVSTNPGEPLKPLSKVASGGELSRMMLALKTIFSKAQGITSIIFDEVDTGVSGRVAQAIADKIHSVAIHSQVLCITHLPQVAAMADQHLFIRKEIENERTKTYVEPLNEEQKTTEIARMLAGAEVTKLTMDTAKELREFAESKKK